MPERRWGCRRDEVEQLRKQTVYLNDIEAMIKSADNYADKAEKLHVLTYIANSNWGGQLRTKMLNWNLLVISWRQLAYDWRTVKVNHHDIVTV